MSRYSQRLFVGQSVSQFGKAGAPEMITKVDAFTATNASYVVPEGVTYMVAYIRGGGGGVGSSGAGAGGTSSVAFASGTISATGGPAWNDGNLNQNFSKTAGTTNSGNGATMCGDYSGVTGYTQSNAAQDGALITAGGAVTAGATLAVTVGAGGTAAAGASGAAGGSGYVYLEYQVKA